MIPLSGSFIIVFAAIAVKINVTKPNHRVRVILHGGLLVPQLCLCAILFHAVSVIVTFSNPILGICDFTLCGFQKIIKGFGVTALPVQNPAQTVLRIRVILRGGLLIIFLCFINTFFYAVSVFVAIAEIEQCPG